MTGLEKDSFPTIMDGSNIYFGGSQEWYHVEWMKWAGCASVAGADLAAYYDARAEHRKPVYTLPVFLTRMREMYKYMTPGIHGFPDPDKFRKRFEQYETDHGKDCSGTVFQAWASWQDALDWITETLESGNPVAMLILRHTAPVIQENTWHWMIITDCDRASGTFSVSNCGKKEMYAASEILQPCKGNQVWLLRFVVSDGGKKVH